MHHELRGRTQLPVEPRALESPIDVSPSVVVVGSLNLDLVIPVPHPPAPGETVLGGDILRTPGGKGANQAVAAARLGSRVAMVGCVGDDGTGLKLIESLEREGVDVSHVRAVPKTPSGIAMIWVDTNGENSIVVSPGANARMAASDVGRTAKLLRTAQVVLIQLEIPLDAVAEATALAQGKVVLNPAPAAYLPADLLERVDVLVPNRAELAALVDAGPLESSSDITAAARAITGPSAIIVTLGGEGALVIEDDTCTHVPAASVKAVDTTAAGDCFCGALADAIASGCPLEEAAQRAAAAAAISVTRSGAQASMPSRADLNRVPATNSQTGCVSVE